MTTRLRYAVLVTALEVQFWFPVWFIFLLDRGFSTSQAAFADGLFRLVATLAEVPAGRFSDRVGRKRSLYFALGGTAITFLLIATVNSLPRLLVAWSIWGVLWALVSGLLTAYGWELGSQLDKTGVEQATDFIRIRRVCAAVAMLFSLVTAGMLYELSPVLPFAVTALLALFVFPVAMRLPEIEIDTDVDASSETPIQQLLKTQGHLRIALFAGAIVLVAGWSIQMVYQPVGLEAGLTPTEISIVFAGFALAQLLGAWLIGRIPVDRNVLLVGAVVGIALMCGGVWLGFYTEARLAMPLFCLVAVGLFYSVGTGYCDVWISELSTTRNRATMLSLVSLLGGVALIFTRPLLGTAAGAASASSAFGIWAAACLVLAGVLWCLLKRGSRR
ncbi:MFS transporter [Corynebacterium afermentans]|uniref:MFS transporter n=1 Tax=Corynebacterium afermentans TaxID=38286 RepID=UPI00257360CD|nr:MFS transporter [Corynebacterium afermentans]MCG7290945.1 MFS transporter [Corynebacterium afermentans]